jgi:RHS repeat-associated protein
MRRTQILSGLAVLLLIASAARPARAQNDPAYELATQPYAAYNGGNIDKIDLFSGNLSLDIPLISYPQKGGKLKLAFGVHYQSGPAMVYQSCDPTFDYCWYDMYSFDHGWDVVQDGVPWAGATAYSDADGNSYYEMSLQTPDGAVRQMEPTTADNASAYCSMHDCYFNGTWRTVDGSGYAMNENSTAETVLGPDGTAYTFPYASGNTFGTGGYILQGIMTSGGPSAYVAPLTEDANGNQISVSTDPYNVTGWTDTTGRQIPAPQTDTPSADDPNPCPSVPGQPSVSWSYVWDLPGPNGGTYPVKFCAIQVSEFYNFWDQGGTQGGGTATELQSIVLPNNTSWQFQYDTTGGTGNLLQITFPTGGTLSYGWNNNGPRLCDPNAVQCFGGTVQTRTLNPANGGASGTWTYAQGTSGGHYTTTVTSPPDPADPNGNDTVHTFTALDTYSYYETEAQHYQGIPGSGGTLLKTVNTTYASYAVGNAVSPLYGYALNVVPTQTTTTWAATGQESEVTYTYDDSGTFYYPYYETNGTYIGGSPWTGTLGAELTKAEYDYGSPGPLTRTTTTAYMFQNNANYLNANLMNLPYSLQVTGAGPGATTYYYYDASGCSSGTCGDLTSVWRWSNTTDSFLTTTNTFDSSGDLTSSKDPNGNTTTYAYGSGYAGSGPASVTNALNQTATYTYDFNTGLLTSVTDPNNQTTSYSYDNMLRTTAVNYPDGGETTYSYGTPSGGQTSVQVAQKIDTSGNWKNSTGVVDGLGRKIQTQLNSDPEGVDFTDTTYDSMGRVASVSNPYRSTSDPTYGITQYRYDALGRPITVTEPDNSTVSTSYSGPCATVTDEAGKKRESCSDALGRLTEVIEDPGGLGYVTTYTYDALDNLTGVNEAGQTRSFVYDSLSRLTSATNPESGTTSYTYDAAGNVATKIDARNITTTYSYDALNRVTDVTFSDGTPPLYYQYDSASVWGIGITNPVGRLVLETVPNDGKISSYDAMGRVTSEWECQFAFNCNSSYGPWETSVQYDLLGGVAQLTYPSGRLVKTTYNTAARPTQVTFDSYSGTYVGYNYLSSASYAPDGSPTSLTLGSGVTETTSYNPRLQTCNRQIATSQSTWVNRTYGYYSGGPCTGSSGNNGNVTAITDNLQNANTQTFSYGPLNRLSSATTQATSGSDCWGEQYGYDAWGNLQSISQPAGYSACTQWDYLSLGFNSQNRITNSGFGYDAAGNLTANNGVSYQYDAENQLTNYGSGAGVYVYDAEGRRIQKQANGATRGYAWSNGHALAEYNAADGGWSDYVYLGDRLLVRADDYEDRIHTYGNNCSNCGWQWSIFWFPNAGGLNGYVIQPGDTLFLRQWQDTQGARAGIGIWFTDGTYTGGVLYDQDGQLSNADTYVQTWHYRKIDLSSEAGKTVSGAGLITEGYTAPGPWSILYQDIEVVGADGTVRTLYSREPSVSLSVAGSSGSTRAYGIIHLGGAICCAEDTTTYYHSDPLGSARLMTNYNGYPVWSATYLPFGTELSPQLTPNHYKFTGKERDSESNLDNFGARYYASSYGRFMTPDWSEKPNALPYANIADPQTLNLYSYVRNNPASLNDPDGHCYPLCTVAAGAGIGFVSGAVAEMAAEWLRGEPINETKVRNAAIAGAVTGAVIGLAGPEAGATLRVGVAVAGNLAGGVVYRTLNGGRVFSGREVLGDVATGLVGGAAEGASERQLASPAIRRIAPAVIDAIVDAGRRATGEAPAAGATLAPGGQGPGLGPSPLIPAYPDQVPQFGPASAGTFLGYDEFDLMQLQFEQPTQEVCSTLVGSQTECSLF